MYLHEVAMFLTLLKLDHLLGSAILISDMQKPPMLIIGVMAFCLSVACLSIWRAAPDFRVLLAMGLFFAAIFAVQVYDYHGGTEYVWAFQVFTSVFFVEMAAEALQIRHHRWTWALWPVYGFIAIAGWFPAAALVRGLPIFISDATLLVLIAQVFRRGSARDRILAIIFFGYFLMRLTRSPTFMNFSGYDGEVSIDGWRWQITGIAVILLGTVTQAIIIRDLIRGRREKQRLEMEVEAARLVQQMLIPEEIPEVAGFSIGSVYKPYGEVGGDFFQILPTANGGVLIVIGDVSGKGMPAAMTVSLLVGTVRTLAHYTQRPEEILTAMNQRMLGRSENGFTTCLVLRADCDGSLKMANAGHLAPYLNGNELKLESGLPLGLAAQATYIESTFSLGLDQQLTLVTDGVVEARNLSGELLGFEQTAAIANEPAESIAQRAREFGQNDDITVLTLVRLATAEEVATEVPQPSLSPSIA
jgi:hypothetical protein